MTATDVRYGRRGGRWGGPDIDRSLVELARLRERGLADGTWPTHRADRCPACHRAPHDDARFADELEAKRPVIDARVRAGITLTHDDRTILRLLESAV